MAIRFPTQRDISLDLGTRVNSPNLTTGALAGYGAFIAGFFRADSGLSGNSTHSLFGFETNTGAWTSSTNGGILVRANSGGAGVLRRFTSRLISTGGGITILWPTSLQDANESLGFPEVGTGSWLVAHGVTNVGSISTPDWRPFVAACEVATTERPGPHSAIVYVGAGPSLATIEAGEGVRLIRRIGTDNASTSDPLGGMAVEHVGYFRGNPTAADFEAWANNTANYLDRPNIECISWWPLTSHGDWEPRAPTTGGTWSVVLTDPGSGRQFEQAEPIAPASFGLDQEITVSYGWQSGRVFAGRGQLVIRAAGGSSGILGMARRYVRDDNGVPLSGALGSWEPVETFDAFTGAWTTADVLPASGAVNPVPYRLELRGDPETSITATLPRFYVGVGGAIIGQSGTYLAFTNSAPFGSPLRPIPLADGCIATLVDFNNRLAGTEASYVRPTPLELNLVGDGTTVPNISQGFISFLNRMHAAGHNPIVLHNMSYSGTSLVSVANNGFIGSPAESGWRYAGTEKALPGQVSAGNVGAYSAHAYLARSGVDFILFHWQPEIGTGYSEISSNWNGAWSRIASLFDGLPQPPVVVMFPAYRSPRSTSDNSQQITKRLDIARIARENDRFINAGAANILLAPCFYDIGMGDDLPSRNLLHPCSNPTPQPDGNGSTGDTNGFSQSRIATSFAACVAAALNPAQRRWGPRVVDRYFRAGRTQIVLETGVEIFTIDDVPLSPRSFSVFNGSSWEHGQASGGPFSAAIEGTKVVLTKTSGSWPAGVTRAAVLRGPYWPNLSDPGFNEANSIEALKAVPYGGPRERLGYPDPEDWAGWPLCDPDFDGGLVNEAPAALGIVNTVTLPPGTYDVQIVAKWPGGPQNGQVFNFPNAVTIQAP